MGILGWGWRMCGLLDSGLGDSSSSGSSSGLLVLQLGLYATRERRKQHRKPASGQHRRLVGRRPPAGFPLSGQD